MKVWKWYTSNEVNQHSFSVCTAKSHSGLTRWQRLESKANTARVLIKGLLLPLTGFNEELEVKDKDTNSDFASCFRPASVPDAALIKDPRSKRWGLSSLFFTGHIAACACSVLALICALFFFSFFSLQCFLCLIGQPISGGSQNSGEFVFLAVKVLCWVISSGAGPRHEDRALHKDTSMQAPNERRRVNNAFCPRRLSTDD